MSTKDSLKMSCRLGLHPTEIERSDEEYPVYNYVCSYKCGWHQGCWSSADKPDVSALSKLANWLYQHRLL